MNYKLLKLTHGNLMGWVRRSQEETVSADKKLEVIMVSLADICTALGTDGSEEAIEAWYAEDDKDAPS